MKKIILTIIFSSFLSTIAVAKDHVMRNDNPNPKASLMDGKHMMNSSPEPSLMSKKHMMNSNPNSSRSSSNDDAGAAKKNSQANKGYSVIEYEK